MVEGHFPEKWKIGYIKPIPKTGAHSDPLNYRGITICSNMSKVFTGVLNNRLSDFIYDHDILHEEQIGFKKGARTSDHMFILKTLIDVYTSKKNQKLYICFVDLKKAYDRVWRTGMLAKLLRSGIGGNFYRIVKSMYQEVNSCVKTHEGYTPIFTSNVGVKQGEVLSPLLFNLYLNDLPDIFNTHCDPINIDGRDLSAKGAHFWHNEFYQK